MKKLLAILLILSLSVQLVLRLSILTWFEINQDYIAATLCENKDKPELVCCGKCVLTKELKKVDDLESGSSKNINTKAEKSSSIHFILPDSKPTSSTLICTETKVLHAIIPHHFGSDISPNIFHPPCRTTVLSA